MSIVKTAGSAADGETFAIAGPGPVTYTYLVENTGNTWLQNVVVVDDKLVTGQNPASSTEAAQEVVKLLTA